METYTEIKKIVDNPFYQVQRRKCLATLSDAMIDKPILDIINGFNELPHCFTLQGCYGHFVHKGNKDPHNFEQLPVTDTITKVEYRIAYIAFCIENSSSGRGLLESLKEIPSFDPENVQVCCAEWFWNKQVNSFALQVEPDRFKAEDKAILDYKEALTIEKVRNSFFGHLHKLLENAKKNKIG